MRSLPPSLPRRYRPLRPLGRGGEGQVWLVRDAHLEGALLALKIIEPLEAGAASAGPDDSSAEFLVLSRLAHPSLSRVRDFGRLPGGTVYFTSDYAPGVDLLEWSLLHPFPSSWSTFHSIAAQALGALHAIHAAGYLHGDVKPAHLIVREDPALPALARLSLIDFGSARLRGARSAARLATPAYLPPPALAQGPEGDLYSLGLSLFQALVGRLPFALGDEEELRRWRASGRAASPAEWLPEVPRPAAALVERLTGPPSGDRFRSAAEPLAFLERAVREARPLPPSSCGPLPLVGREEPLSRVLAGIESPAAPLVVVAGPPGLGKSRLLEEALRRAQVLGFRTVVVAPGSAGAALDQLREILGMSGSGPADPEEGPERTGERLLERTLSRRVLVALDGVLDLPEEAAGTPPQTEPFARRAWAGFARAYLESRPGEARLVAAASRPERIRRLARGAEGRLEVVKLEPLGREPLRQMAVDFFRTSAIPEGVVERLAAGSRGEPGRARSVLLEMARAGTRTDLLGMLLVPEKPAEGTEPSSPGTGPLSPLHRLALEVVGLSPRPLDAAETARYALLARPEAGGQAEAGGEVWEAILEDLQGEGHLRERTLNGSYEIANGAAARPPCELDPALRRRIQEAILADLKRKAPLPGTRDGDLLAALARSASRAGQPLLAARAGRLAVRRLRKSRRIPEALSLLSEIQSGPGAAALPRRAAALLALRGVELALLDGRKREGEEAGSRLEPLGEAGSSRTLRARALLARSGIEEQGGRLEAAGGKLEEARALLEPPDGESPPAAWYEATARLAAHRFALGRSDLAAPLLLSGEELARTITASLEAAGETAVPPRGGRGGPAGDLPAAARALARFGALLSRHGEPARAVGLLEAGLGAARRAGRRDLEAGSLHELALAHAAAARYREAEAALLTCQAIAEAAGDRSALLRVRVNLATLYQKSGDLDRAESLFLSARIVADELGEEGAAQAAWMGLELIQRDRGDLLQALRLGRGILNRFPRSRKTLHAMARFNLGEIYLALGRPEEARRQRARALALARACDYRFLIRYGLFGLGVARWAVGDLRGAENRFQAALGRGLFFQAGRRRSAEGEDGSADHLLLGAVHLYRGLGAGLLESGREPLRILGRAMFHARRAGSRPHLDGALLGLVDLLLRRGARSRARAILSRRERAAKEGGPGLGRHRLLAEGLAVRARPDWPASLSELLSAADRAAAGADLFAALRIVCDAIRDPEFREGAPALLLARREELAARFLKRSSDRDRAFFRVTHGSAIAGPGAARPPTSPAVGLPAPGEAAERPPLLDTVGPAEGDPLARLALRWAAEHQGTDPGARLESELARLAAAIPARGLWVLNPPGMREPMFYASAERGPPLDLFSSRAPLIENVRTSGRPHWGEGFSAVALPGGPARGKRSPRRVLYLELGETAASGAALQDRVLIAAGLLASFLRAGWAESEARASQTRLEESGREIHRLNALLLRGKGQAETAVITQRLLLVEKRRAREAQRFSSSGPPEPIALSPAMKGLVQRLRKIAARDIPVLLLGEHGVGKDLLARAIHWESPRREGPFVSEVCAVPESLLESELFGYVRGAFTDAQEDRPGLLQLCRGGTLYLDEISELPAGLQRVLIRAIEERRARPLGSEESVPIDFRLISSSRRPLAELERSSIIRGDFLYRIRGEVLEVPPLRDRREDIPPLVNLFVAECAREEGRPPPQVSPETLEELGRRDWPGNVRQLENEVRRAFLLSPARLTLESFEGPGDGLEEGGRGGAAAAAARRAARSAIPFRAARGDFERELIAEALRAHRGNASRASRSLKITRRYLGILIEKHRLRLADFLPPAPGREGLDRRKAGGGEGRADATG